jgi:hypothetical protein
MYVGTYVAFVCFFRMHVCTYACMYACMHVCMHVKDARNSRPTYACVSTLNIITQEGIEPEAFLSNPEFSPALRRVIQRLLDRADELYLRADAGISMLPRSCRIAIRFVCYVPACMCESCMLDVQWHRLQVCITRAHTHTHTYRAARLIYSDIGYKLAQRGYNSVAKRTVVSKKRKIVLALKVCMKDSRAHVHVHVYRNVCNGVVKREP